MNDSSNTPAHFDVMASCSVCNRRFEWCVEDTKAPLLWECAGCGVVMCDEHVNNDGDCDACEGWWLEVGVEVDCPLVIVK